MTPEACKKLTVFDTVNAANSRLQFNMCWLLTALKAVYMCWCRCLAVQVNHLEPWEKGSRKTAGQTGMCGGVSIASALQALCHCHVYSCNWWFTGLKLTSYSHSLVEFYVLAFFCFSFCLFFFSSCYSHPLSGFFRFQALVCFITCLFLEFLNFYVTLYINISFTFLH